MKGFGKISPSKKPLSYDLQHPMRDTNLVTREEAQRLLSKPKRSKYRAVKTVVDGITFDSKHEADIYTKLKLEECAGLIRAIACQVSFDLIVNEYKICTYIADFVVKYANGLNAVIDAKGYRTREYRLKKKLMLAVKGIAIEER
jgi:hypothetical protein